MSRQFKAKVISNTRLNDGVFLLVLRPLSETFTPYPGQFYMIGQSGATLKDPLLKRPFSCMDYKDGLLYLLIKVRGKLTAILRDYTAGNVLELIGPLGNGFPAVGSNERLIVAAGGIGIASVLMLMKAYPQAVLFYGVRSDSDLFVDILPKRAEVYITSDDGTVGLKGSVLQMLKQYLSSATDDVKLYACGPHTMTEQLCRMFSERGRRCRVSSETSMDVLPKIDAYVSIEERMACGVATCLGCTVDTVNGYRLVCKDGPVFNVNDVILPQT
ncbi:MAG: dihydroorotate dehydrogenase electron transfer subunit [Nitrospirae bacterium]|nr:dihydroorotate dehydrogenase electron transfer subunit [Nitrospirota bacterium]